MRYTYKDIKSLQLEITSNCNAACPQCPRNYHGGNTISELPLITWTLSDLKKILDKNFLKQLKFVYFCGTYGDPMFNKDIVNMCHWLKNHNPFLAIGIHTNGGLGSSRDYHALAQLVKFMSFGIDGLEKTNSIYRRNTVWSKIMKNAKTFIGAGGQAHWDFIVFEHNQHEVDQARLLSDQLGFKTFNVKKTYRFFNKSHDIVPYVNVHNTDNKKIYEIHPTTIEKFSNKSIEKIKSLEKKIYVDNTKITCKHLEKQEIYIGSDGYVFPCGWLHDRLYGIESQQTPDRAKIYEMMEKIGGKHLANCFQTPLESIVDGLWFQAIQESWSSDRLERCAWLCGDTINVIEEQNEFLQYDF
jgi:MoaA/NifB/PqqE/SkfB family radical SAM enzyme